MAQLGRGTQSLVTAQMDADYAAGLIGKKTYILPIGEKMRYEIIDNNTVRIYDGVVVSQGRYVYQEANTYEDFIIENGVQSENRIDIIGFKITTSSEKDTCEKFVKKDAMDPALGALVEGDLRAGDTELLIPLYQVNLEGLSIVSVEPIVDSIKSIKQIIKQSDIDWKQLMKYCDILEKRIDEQILQYDDMLSDSETEYTQIRNQKTVVNRRTGEVNIYARLYFTKDVPAGKNFKVATVSSSIGQVAFGLPVTITTAITSTSQAKAGYFPLNSEYPFEIRVASLTEIKSGGYAYIHLQYFPEKIMLNLQDTMISKIRGTVDDE